MSRRQRDRQRVRRTVTTPEDAAPSEGARAAGGLVYSRWTVILGGGALFTVVSGFALLAQGSLTLAPILLVVGFVGLIPAALVK